MRKLYVRANKNAPKPGLIEAPAPTVVQTANTRRVRFEDAIFYRTGIESHDGRYLYDEYNPEALRGSPWWPEGCNRQYVTNMGGNAPERIEDVPIWFGEIHESRTVYQFIYLGWVRGVINAMTLPVNFIPSAGHIISVAERPQRNCNFNRCAVFRPRWNHLYIGSGYR